MVWYNPLNRLSESSRPPVEALEHKGNPSRGALKRFPRVYTTADLSNLSHNLSPAHFQSVSPPLRLMAAAIPPGMKIALDGTLGAAFLGHFVTTMCVHLSILNVADVSKILALPSLYGITSLQAYIYYRDQTKDSWILRYSVRALFP